MRETSLKMDPYRLLFPLGWANGLLGASIWILFYLTNRIAYPGSLHANVMMGGFQFCFAAGFLMTAIPRFTGTDSASPVELALAGSLGGLLLAVSLAAVFDPGLSGWLHGLVVALSAFLGIYFLRRFLRRAHSPPSSFSFVGAAILFALLGSLALALANRLPASVVLLGRLVFYHGMMLALVLGVGSRLVTANLGWMQSPIIQITRQTRTVGPFEFLGSSYGTSLLLTVLFVASFVIEATIANQVGRILRALVASFVIHPQWQLHRLPRTRTKMAFWLWVSAWSVFLGLWAYALSPTYLAVAGAHFMFIGGFALMIFMIASRVTLSHGGFDVSVEATSMIYPVLGILTVFSALARVIAGMGNAQQAPILIVIAACSFIFALLAWGFLFLGKILKPKHARTTIRSA
jgi:uncharacterized protein involved in response to NO